VPGTSSGTSYETRLLATAEANLQVFVTEFAQRVKGPVLEDILEGKPVARPVEYMTRLRTVITPAAMDRDVELVPAVSAKDVRNVRSLGARERGGVSAAGIGGVRMVLVVGAWLLRRRGWRVMAVGCVGVALMVL
jgi:hypothetical protein